MKPIYRYEVKAVCSTPNSVALQNRIYRVEARSMDDACERVSKRGGVIAVVRVTRVDLAQEVEA